MRKVHIILSGKVQGVTFREHARKNAEKLGITGFVKNLQDGTVEIIAEGDDDKINIFIRECKRGPLMAFVKKADIREERPTGGFEGFEIRF
ncbi:acylphosphatase [Candidatus Woesearchaeota archaeon]|nr:acylphosphatase [Candidatus Woesearchaeota archaeon]